MGQVAPFGAMTDTQGATSSKGVRGGAMSSKGATGGPWRHNLKLTLDILELQMKSKKQVLGVFYGSLETYTKYSWVADEEQKKKKVLCVFYRSLWVTYMLKGAIAFSNSLKVAICNKVWETLV